METQSKFYRYLEWKSPEEMHFSVLQWISQMDFIRDENNFLEEMLKEFTIPLLEAHLLEKAKELETRLSDIEKEEREQTKKLIVHRNELKIITVEQAQPEEEQKYKEEHRKLKDDISGFMKKYQVLKKEIFEMISTSMKKQKQGKLLT